MRINGWSQFAAMISVPFLAYLLEFTALHTHLGLPSSGLGPFAAKIILLTPMTITIWFVVTVLTPADTPETIEQFRKVVPPFRRLFPKIVLALLAGVAYFWLWVWLVDGLVGWLSEGKAS